MKRHTVCLMSKSLFIENMFVFFSHWVVCVLKVSRRTLWKRNVQKGGVFLLNFHHISECVLKIALINCYRVQGKGQADEEDEESNCLAM
jgi:hypothetical protein